LPMDGLDVKEDLTITERPVRILESWHGLQETGLSQCARCSGVITQRMRQLGKERRNWKRIIHISLIHPNLEDEIHLKGVGFVTDQISLLNLIKILLSNHCSRLRNIR
jgi:hypothetical protein